MKNTKIVFIGCGNIGSSLIGGLLSNGYPSDLLCGVDQDPEQREKIKTLFDIEVYQNSEDAIGAANIAILAVKPQDMEATVASITDQLLKHAPLIVSLAAGIRTTTITEWLGDVIPVIRIMPNTPALIQAGVAALFANEKTSMDQRELAEMIMRSVGTTIWVDDEVLMDTVTAVSGSGPAYFFLIMEIMEKAAMEMGLPQEQARLLTLETAFGAAKMAIESDLDPSTLRQQVTSPGGTTERALQVLHQGKIEILFHEALAAAKNRSIELADSFGGKQ